MAIKPLTEEQAESRLGWLMGHAGRELERGMLSHTGPGLLDAQDIERLREISRVASQVAKHYEERGV